MLPIWVAGSAGLGADADPDAQGPVAIEDVVAAGLVLGRARALPGALAGGDHQGPGPSAFPQVRVVAVGECGTHTVIAAAMDSYDVAEVTLAMNLLPAVLGPGMLLLADRGCTGFPLWEKAAATGTDRLWRVKSHAVLPYSSVTPTGRSAPSWSPAPTSTPEKRDTRAGLWSTRSTMTGDGAPPAPSTG